MTAPTQRPTPETDSMQTYAQAVEEMMGHCALIQVIIERVENRCMAADGFVTPTNREIRNSELQQIYQAAMNAIHAGMKARP